MYIYIYIYLYTCVCNHINELEYLYNQWAHIIPLLSIPPSLSHPLCLMESLVIIPYYLIISVEHITPSLININGINII